MVRTINLSIEKMKYYEKIILLMLSFLIATEGIFVGIKMSIIDIHRFIEIIIFLYFINTIIYEINHSKLLRIIFRFQLFLFLLLSLKLFTVTFIYEEISTSIFWDMARLFLMFMLFYLIFIYLKYMKNGLRIILLFNFPIMLIAFMQFNLFPFSDFAWDFKNTYFANNSVDLAMSNDADTQTAFRTRVIGLYGFSIPLAYILSVNMIMTAYLYLKSNNFIYILYLVFLGVISIFTLTRSILLSWFVIMSYILFKFFKNTKFSTKVVSFIILLIFSIFAVNQFTSNSSSFNRLSGVEDASAAGRIPLALTGTYAMVSYPFGVSKNAYDDIKKEMFQIYHQTNILNFTSHNGIIQFGLTYTLIGFFVLAYFLMNIFRILRDTLDKEMYIFMLVAFFTYLVNALFHNNFIFVEDYYSMIILALLVYEYDLNTKNRGLL